MTQKVPASVSSRCSLAFSFSFLARLKRSCAHSRWASFKVFRTAFNSRASPLTRPEVLAEFLSVTLGLQAEPITQRSLFRVEETVVDGEDRASFADLKLIPSLYVSPRSARLPI